MKDNTSKKLEKIFINIFSLNVKKINTTKIKNLTEKNFSKWDSLKKLNLIIAVEEEFNFKVKDKLVDKFSSFQNILKIINTSIKKRK